MTEHTPEPYLPKTPEEMRLREMLASVQNELLEQIDGGDEAKHRDTWISALVRQIGIGLGAAFPYDVSPKIAWEVAEYDRLKAINADLLAALERSVIQMTTNIDDTEMAVIEAAHAAIKKAKEG